MTTQVAQAHTAYEPDLDTYHDMSVGEILLRTREYYGQTIPQVEANLRIRSSHLIALEQGDLANLPGRVYAIGFVRAYAEYLGLDGDKMVHLFKAQSVGKDNKPILQFPVTYKSAKTPSPYLILGCLGGLILLIAYWSITYVPKHHIEHVPPVPEALKQSSVARLNPPIASAPDQPLLPMLVPSNSRPEMQLVIVADSWVEIKNARGEVLVREVLKPGSKFTVPDEAGMTLSTGNAGGIEVHINGKRTELLGKLTEVRRDVALNPDDFR